MRKLRTIQALRAAACLMVVAYHTLEGRWANGAAGVDVFFVVSGLVMGLVCRGLAPRPDGWRRFAEGRLCRLLPLYWGLTLLKLAIGAVLPATLAAARPGPWNILASFLFVPSRDGAGLVRPVLGVGWTLQFEMLFYALVALALASRRKPWPWVPALLLPLALAGFWRQPDWPAPLALANGLVLEFCLGLILAEAATAIERLPAIEAVGLAISGAGLLLALPSASTWRFAAWGLPAAALVAGALALERRLGPAVPGWLVALGDGSFAIYLLHPFLAPALLQGWHRAFGASQPAQAGLVAACLILCSLAGHWLNVGLDKPVQAWLRRRRAGSSGSTPPAAGHIVQF